MRSLSFVALCLLVPAVSAAEPFRLADGDRVVWLGNTLIEREQLGGWWELALTTRFPAARVVHRNLGWSGDTVFGHARAGFGSVADGYKHLVEHTLALKPTVLIIGYGRNESFEGAEKLPAFVNGLDKLLDQLEKTKARIVLLGPPRQADLGRPLPDPSRQNRHLRLYADAIREVAAKRGHRFVDLYDLLGDLAKARPAVTANGVHLTEAGYRWSAALLENELGLPERPRRLTLSLTPGGPAQEHTAAPLPLEPTRVVVPGLAAGRYTLWIDGKPAATAEAGGWAEGVAVATPEAGQVETLRREIIAKNELYFHRWRPQNVTYLFGFRKHEQGKNAREIPLFDPLVAAREATIAERVAPVAHRYALTVAGK